jgi:hypothetical protein
MNNALRARHHWKASAHLHQLDTWFDRHHASMFIRVEMHSAHEKNDPVKNDGDGDGDGNG